MWSVIKLIVIPAISAFLAVWWLTKLSEKFFEKNEEYKSNKRIIERKLEYTEKVKISIEQKEIRDMEFDKQSIQYEDNPEFNKNLDEINDDVRISGILVRPSEALYKCDYEAYKEELQEWRMNRF